MLGLMRAFNNLVLLLKPGTVGCYFTFECYLVGVLTSLTLILFSILSFDLTVCRALTMRLTFDAGLTLTLFSGILVPLLFMVTLWSTGLPSRGGCWVVSSLALEILCLNGMVGGVMLVGNTEICLSTGDPG